MGGKKLSASEIIRRLNIPPRTVRDRMIKLNIVGVKDESSKGSLKTVYYNYDDLIKLQDSFENSYFSRQLVKKKTKKIDPLIYYNARTIIQETEIIHSKLNFLTLKQL